MFELPCMNTNTCIFVKGGHPQSEWQESDLLSRAPEETKANLRRLISYDDVKWTLIWRVQTLKFPEMTHPMNSERAHNSELGIIMPLYSVEDLTMHIPCR